MIELTITQPTKKMTTNKSEPSAEEEAEKLYPKDLFNESLRHAYSRGWNARQPEIEKLTARIMELEALLKTSNKKKLEPCPFCESNNVVMFTSDYRMKNNVS